MALRKFTKPKFLEQIGRGLLKRLLDEYRAEFDREGVVLPADSLEDREYYAALAKLALAEQGLPESFIEALYEVEAMANEYGKARLIRAVEEAGLALTIIQEATYADFAVQVLLADPVSGASTANWPRPWRLRASRIRSCRPLGGICAST
jgi:hypothetical protein